jgi:hypothetical protein
MLLHKHSNQQTWVTLISHIKGNRRSIWKFGKQGNQDKSKINGNVGNHDTRGTLLSIATMVALVLKATTVTVVKTDIYVSRSHTQLVIFVRIWKKLEFSRQLLATLWYKFSLKSFQRNPSCPMPRVRSAGRQTDKHDTPMNTSTPFPSPKILGPVPRRNIPVSEICKRTWKLLVYLQPTRRTNTQFDDHDCRMKHYATHSIIHSLTHARISSVIV